MNKWTALIALSLINWIGFAVITQSATPFGGQVQGPVVVGNCVKWASAAAPYLLADAGAPCSSTSMTIGQTVTGATPSSGLSVDANGHLAQTNVLIAN